MKRREFLGAMASAAAAAPVVVSGGSPLAPLPLGKAEHCAMIWLGGGMAQIDTFDPTTNLFDLDRPVPITDSGRPIASLLS